MDTEEKEVPYRRGLGVAAAGLGGAQALQYALDPVHTRVNVSIGKNFFKQTKPLAKPENKYLFNPLHRASGVGRGPDTMMSFPGSSGMAAWSPRLKSYLFSEDQLVPEIIAHEVGHATPTSLLGKGLARLRQISSEPGTANKIFEGVRVGGPAALFGAGTLANKKSTRFNLAQKAALPLYAAGQLLPFAEEARASLRGINLARKAGIPLQNKNLLLKALGSYATKPVANIAAASLPVILTALMYRQNRKRQEEAAMKKTSSEIADIVLWRINQC
jgi:hypothetical protein